MGETQMKRSLGIIGFGRFGQLCARELAPHFDVSVSNRSDKRAEAEHLGVEYASMAECAGKEFVLFCVPIPEFENALELAAPHFKNGALIMDTCSIKEEPAALMRTLVPERCDALGTHPLFGPDTATNGPSGLNVVLCPIRIGGERLAEVKEFLSALGLNVIVATPEEHDTQMARSQALIHFIGRAFDRMDLGSITMRTKTVDSMENIVSIVKSDSDALFEAIETRNRHAAGARKKLVGELTRLDCALSRPKKKIRGRRDGV